MTLTKEQFMEAARSIAMEQLSADPYLPDKGKLVITPPNLRGGWRATMDGTTCNLNESAIFIRALVFAALKDD